MSKKIIVVIILFISYATYSAWVYTKGTALTKPLSFLDEQQKGKQLWQKYNCSSCHQLYGLGGFIGPDLTNVISDKKRGKAFASAMIKVGNNVMPNFQLKDEEVSCLVSYLSYIDSTVNNQNLK
jgi:nitric oxide reductase subunit C